MNHWIIYAEILLLVGLARTANGQSDSIFQTKEIYKTVDSLQLEIHVFQSNKTLERNKNTAIIFFHGGGWTSGSPMEFFDVCRRYANMGVVAFSACYRLSVSHGKVPHREVSPIESLMDAKSAVRWVRENAARFGIDENKVVAAGQSAGGHLAISTAMIDAYNDSADDPEMDCRPDAVLLFSACLNTVMEWCDYLLGDRRHLIWSISPAHHIREDLPPMIQFHGKDDGKVEFWTVRFFKDEMEKKGNTFELHALEGRKHYLGDGTNKYANYFDDEILEIADDFLRKHHFTED
tara:strand:+ start:468 stop:1343 length:876 start_codon:yes stop_codon:yes gene_type:complete